MGINNSLCSPGSSHFYPQNVVKVALPRPLVPTGVWPLLEWELWVVDEHGRVCIAPTFLSLPPWWPLQITVLDPADKVRYRSGLTPYLLLSLLSVWANPLRMLFVPAVSPGEVCLGLRVLPDAWQKCHNKFGDFQQKMMVHHQYGWKAHLCWQREADKWCEAFLSSRHGINPWPL